MGPRALGSVDGYGWVPSVARSMVSAATGQGPFGVCQVSLLTLPELRVSPVTASSA